MAAVRKDTVRRLMPVVPGQLRTILGPELLLEKLDVTPEAAEADAVRGIRLLIEETSGNYRIEEPFLNRLYEVTVDRARLSPGETARLVYDTPFPLEGLILNQPAAAVTVLSANPALSIELTRYSDPLISPPARIIHVLTQTDPAFAAGMVIALDRAGQQELVVEALAYFAYDKVRGERYPQLPISLSQAGAFLESLLDSQGAEWLQTRIGESVELHRGRASAGEVAPDFLDRYLETLLAAADTLDRDARGRLMAVVRAAFE